MIEQLQESKYTYGANNDPFMNNEIRKAIMKRTRMRNKYPKNQCATTRKTYISRKNLCVSIVRKIKWDYYSKLDHKMLTNDKTFWKIVKLFFTNKRIKNEKLLFTKEGEAISVDKKISEKTKD